MREPGSTQNNATTRSFETDELQGTITRREVGISWSNRQCGVMLAQVHQINENNNTALLKPFVITTVVFQGSASLVLVVSFGSPRRFVNCRFTRIPGIRDQAPSQGGVYCRASLGETPPPSLLQNDA